MEGVDTFTSLSRYDRGCSSYNHEILRGVSSGLVLPEGLPAGTYHLYLAVYDWRDVTRLSLADGTTAFRLAELRLP